MTKFCNLIKLILRYINAKTPELGMALNKKRYNQYDSIDVYKAKILIEIMEVLRD